jgi:WD40 repeat protein
MEPIAIDSKSCTNADFVNPQVLENGDVGLLAWCLPLTDGVSELLSLSLASGESQVLVRPDDVPRDFSWSPEIRRAVVWGGGLICGGLAWITDQGIEDMDVVVSNGRQQFVMSDAYASRAGRCDQTGRASSPAWSPDGATIAFFASPASVGLEGDARVDAPWGVYVLEPGDEVATLVLDEVIDPRGPCWSPDSQLLAFTGRIANSTSTWALDFPGSRLFRLTSSALESCEWSPDGGSLAGLVPTDGGGTPGTSDIVRIDTAQLLDP